MGKITFDTIAGGELAEKFRVALAQIGRNILDPNMDPDVSRGMAINLKYKQIPAFSLIEAEGGAWKNEAVARIKEYFSSELAKKLTEEELGRFVIIG